MNCQRKYPKKDWKEQKSLLKNLVVTLFKLFKGQKLRFKKQHNTYIDQSAEIILDPCNLNLKRDLFK